MKVCRSNTDYMCGNNMEDDGMVQLQGVEVTRVD